MEQIRAAQAARYETSLASTQPSEPLDIPSKEECTTLAEQRNLPGFLLLDAVRFYKRAQGEQVKLTPLADALRENVRLIQREITTLQQEQHDIQKRLGKAEARVEGVSKEQDRLEQDVTTAQQEILRTTARISQNGQQTNEHAMLMEVQKKELCLLRSRLEQLEKLVAQYGRTQGQSSETTQVASTQHNHGSSLTTRQQEHPASPLPTTVSPKPSIAQCPSKLSAGKQKRSNETGGTVSERANPSKRRRTSRRPHVIKQTTLPSVEEVTASEASYRQDSPGPEQLCDEIDASRAGEASPVPASDTGLSVISNGTAAGATRAYLTNLFIEAQQRHAIKQPVGLRSHHQLIWRFIDSIADKALSKRFQSFLLEHQEPGYVANGPWSASYERQLVKRHRFIKLVDVTWLQFTHVFRDFLMLSHGSD